MRSFRGCLVLCEHAETRTQTHGNGDGDSLIFIIFNQLQRILVVAWDDELVEA
jgi:hypothetical protein